MPNNNEKIAIIGSGIAGLSCAYFLQNKYDVTLFEKASRLGGHTSTVSLETNTHPLNIDTGFMVLNHKTYPNLIKLFERLDVAIQPTCMSFSFNQVDQNLEWSGLNLNTLFGQRKNLFSPSFYKLVAEMAKFNTHVVKDLAENPALRGYTLREYVQHHHYSNTFLNNYLIPLTGAIWSTQPKKMEAFPIETLVNFLNNHGMLGLNDHLQWYTVTGGSKSYIEKMLPSFKNAPQLNADVASLETQTNGEVIVHFNNLPSQSFSKVIVATHADQALNLLKQPTALESELLSEFSYELNPTALHSQTQVMPKTRRTWASWNYRTENNLGELKNSTHYWMSRLQNLKADKNYFVSLNSDHLLTDNSEIYFREDYTHPVFNQATTTAQSQLPQLNEQEHNLYFCGSYFGYGFHEDALKAGILVSEKLLGHSVWQ